MNALDDLRNTLATHADDVGPGGADVRRTSVHHRIGAVRRRRRAAAGSVVAAVAAVAAGVTLLPGDATTDPQLASAVVGVPVRDAIVATGYTFEADQVVKGADGVASVTLGPSEEQRLVSWATSGDDQSVTVTGGAANQPLHFTDADFDSWILVARSDSPQTVEVAASSGDVGLVVYAVGDEPPAGFSKSGVVARGTVAGGELVGAEVSDPGQAEVTVPVTATGRTVYLHYACAGAPRGSSLNVDRDGEEFIPDARCDETLPVDMSGLSDSGYESRPGERFVFTATVNDGPTGPLVESDTVRVALTVYSENAVGDAPPYLVEEAGHTWRLVGQHDASGADPLVVRSPAGNGPVWAVAQALRGSANADFGGAGGAGMDGGSVSELIDADQEVSLAPRGAAAERRILFYERAD